jgi:hypothetical protein
MLKLDENTMGKIQEALNKEGPIRVTIEKNLKGTVTIEVSERSLVGFANA